MAHILTMLRKVPCSFVPEAAELAKELGLNLQAQRYAKPLVENDLTALTDIEVTLWQSHCPTIYHEIRTLNWQRLLSDYAFDSVPLEVMRHWKAIKDRYAFDSYQIWTTERTHLNNDPLLIGILGTRLYLHARWGLESPEQLPLKQIAQEIYDETHKGWAARIFHNRTRLLNAAEEYLGFS